MPGALVEGLFLTNPGDAQQLRNPKTLDALARACDEPQVAAVLLESVQGEGGVVPAPDGYLEGARRICDERGLLLMLDEVQTGLGRTGRWFGFQHHGIRPDVVTVGKALGNGVPVAACWARGEVAAAFEPGDHGSTFGGQPLAAAAATATIDRLMAIDAPGRAAERGSCLTAGLAELDGVESVRGAGLLLAAVLATRGTAKQVTARALEEGLVANAPTPDVVRLAPPITVSEAEIAEAVAILGAAIRSVTRDNLEEVG
jgi:acetylornithine/succinyldiaminopimelate/putrescine aminotransferase